MSLEATKPIIFAGEFRHGIDPKNRVTIPSAWRAAEGSEVFVRVHSSGSHIVAMPPEQFHKKVAKIEGRTDINAGRQQQLIRQLSSGSQICSVDKQGRMVLPPEFCTKAGLQGEVILVGAYGQFEIWNAARWSEQQVAEETENEDLANELGL
jgi:MraZ protein